MFWSLIQRTCLHLLLLRCRRLAPNEFSSLWECTWRLCRFCLPRNAVEALKWIGNFCPTPVSLFLSNKEFKGTGVGQELRLNWLFPTREEIFALKRVIQANHNRESTDLETQCGVVNTSMFSLRKWKKYYFQRGGVICLVLSTLVDVISLEITSMQLLPCFHVGKLHKNEVPGQSMGWTGL